MLQSGAVAQRSFADGENVIGKGKSGQCLASDQCPIAKGGQFGKSDLTKGQAIGKGKFMKGQSTGQGNTGQCLALIKGMHAHRADTFGKSDVRKGKAAVKHVGADGLGALGNRDAF